MEPFEDDNPFESEPERLQSDSSSSRVDVSGVSSPDLPGQPAHLSSPPTSPSRRNTFPSPGSHRQPQQTYKSDFCCGRDQWLHSGEEAEILVSLCPTLCTLSFLLFVDHENKPFDFCIDNGRSQNLGQLLVSVHHVHNPSGGKQMSLGAPSLVRSKTFLRVQKPIIGIQSSSRYATTLSSSIPPSLYPPYPPSRLLVITPLNRPRRRKTLQ